MHNEYMLTQINTGGDMVRPMALRDWPFEFLLRVFETFDRFEGEN